jgi:hypothetical protein
VDNFNIYPNTRLGKLVKAKKVEDILDLCDDYCPGQPPEFFFDRSWHSFNSILDVYRTGLLHLNNDMCALVLQVRFLDVRWYCYKTVDPIERLHHKAVHHISVHS